MCVLNVIANGLLSLLYGKRVAVLNIKDAYQLCQKLCPELMRHVGPKATYRGMSATKL